MTRQYARGECPTCNRRFRLTTDGALYEHPGRPGVSNTKTYNGGWCLGGGSAPEPGTVREPSPANIAAIIAAGFTPDQVTDMVSAVDPAALPVTYLCDTGADSWWERHYWTIAAAVAVIAGAACGFAIGVGWAAR